MAAAIVILVGTMTGTAELVADEMAAVIESDSDHPVEVIAMDGLNADIFDRDAIFIICTSTYGQGDVPDNAVNLFEDLQKIRPNLDGKLYGVFGLGDSTYDDTFNFGGKQFDDLLRTLGARRVGARAEHNASSAEIPEDEGVKWVREWLTELAEQTAPAA